MKGRKRYGIRQEESLVAIFGLLIAVGIGLS
jgi:hypothetical protein